DYDRLTLWTVPTPPVTAESPGWYAGAPSVSGSTPRAMDSFWPGRSTRLGCERSRSGSMQRPQGGSNCPLVSQKTDMSDFCLPPLWETSSGFVTKQNRHLASRNSDMPQFPCRRNRQDERGQIPPLSAGGCNDSTHPLWNAGPAWPNHTP